MAISYPLDFPSTLGLGSFSLDFRNAVARTESSFSYVEKLYAHTGEIWEIKGTSMDGVDRELGEEWNSFIFALRGRRGTFLFGDPAGATPRGVGGGTPLVKGAGQSGTTLNIDGGPLSTTGYLKKGDYFQLGTSSSSRLYKLVQDADTNGSGETTLTFIPALRSVPADNAALVINNARGLFRLASSKNGFSIRAPFKYSGEFSALEVVTGS